METAEAVFTWYYELNVGYKISIILTALLFYSYLREAERAPQDKLVVIFYLFMIGVYTIIFKGLTILF